MNLKQIVVYTSDDAVFEAIQRVIPMNFAEVLRAADISIIPGVPLALIDGRSRAGEPNRRRALLEQLVKGGVYCILIEDETKQGGLSVPEELADGLADDLLLLPLRPLELLGKLQHYSYVLRSRELFAINEDVRGLAQKLEEDLKLARSIQRGLIPEKFAPVPGLKVTHRYLSGIKSGGDYLDFFEFADKTHIGVLMTDSSGYGISSALLSLILRLAVRLSRAEPQSPTATIEKIYAELQLTMKLHENFSIFYGVLNRKTFEMKFASCGSIAFLHQRGDVIDDLSSRLDPLRKGHPLVLADKRIMLMPEDRIALFTDGFAECFREPAEIEQALRKVRDTDGGFLANEFTFRAKQRLHALDGDAEEMGLMPQDCALLLIDIEKRAIRLAQAGA